jgi:spore coat polysaccharide biosynthesis protein SpsF (cytidylyltransferase family)
MGSSRLPGKVMKPVMGRPLLGHLLDRLRLCLTIDEIIVATAVAKENDLIEEFCVKENISCYRGSENDVLDRTLSALIAASATIGVEVYGDCPLIDPQIVDQIVGYFIHNPGYDFVSNDLKTTYPPGMEVEVFRVAALADSSQKLKPNHPDREHGTLFIRKHPEHYKIYNISAPEKYSRPELELEVDTIEDFEVLSEIIEHFKSDPRVTLEEIINFLDKNPLVKLRNTNVHRRWKMYRIE